MLKPVPLALAVLLTLAGVSSAGAQTFGSYGTFGSQNIYSVYRPISISRPITPHAVYSSLISTRMIQAAGIAEASAERRSTAKCWRYVKRALLKANAVSSYPKTVYAKQAARELTRDYGFRRLPIRDPNKAPVGSVLVYGGNGAGHVEIRTPRGYVSDYRSRRPCGLPFIGAYAKTK